jgi:hypothetical protein
MISGARSHFREAPRARPAPHERPPSRRIHRGALVVAETGRETPAMKALVQRTWEAELSPPFLPEDILPLPRRELRRLRALYPRELDRIIALIRGGIEANATLTQGTR